MSNSKRSLSYTNGCTLKSTRTEGINMIQSYGLDSNNHAVYKLNYHLLLTIKYRRKVITHQIGKLLEETFKQLQDAHQIQLQEIGYEQDHVHYLFTAAPTTNLSKFINAYKSSTSRKIRERYPNVKEKLWKGQLWSNSYFLTTTGGTPLEIIQQYIANQDYMKEGKNNE